MNTCGPPCQPIRCGLARSVIGRLLETDPDASTITALSTSIPAEGDSISGITVQLKDANGNITTDATVALNSTRPSMDSHRPSRVCTLFATATWVCRSGSPAGNPGA